MSDFVMTCLVILLTPDIKPNLSVNLKTHACEDQTSCLGKNPVQENMWSDKNGSEVPDFKKTLKMLHHSSD